MWPSIAQPIPLRKAMVLLLLTVTAVPGCTFLPVKTPRPGTTVVYVLPPDVKTKVVLYLPDNRWRSLVKVEKEAVSQGEQPYLTALRELMSSGITDRTARLFPQGTHLVTEPALNRGVLYLNFSREIQRIGRVPESAERLLLEALVRTLTEYKEVTAIQLLIDGQKVETLVGRVDISKPLTREQFGLDKKNPKS